jgi:hypothetical protein
MKAKNHWARSQTYLLGIAATAVILGAVWWLFSYLSVCWGCDGFPYGLTIIDAHCENDMDAVIVLRNTGTKPLANLNSCTIKLQRAVCGDVAVEKLNGSRTFTPTFSTDTARPKDVFVFTDKACKGTTPLGICRYRFSPRSMMVTMTDVC